MELYVASAPKKTPPGGKYFPVWAVCCTGARLRVCPDPPEGGFLMVLYAEPIAADGVMVRDIVRFCLERRYSGIVLDFPAQQNNIAVLVRQLTAICRQYGIATVVPKEYATRESDFVLVPATLIGGDLRRKLEQETAQYGAGRIVLDLERTCRDYLLPCPGGSGCALTRGDFERLSAGCARYFSPELCARYFTYRSGIQSHYVVYDDRDTLRRKLTLAEELGIGKALVMYHEVEDLWPFI